MKTPLLALVLATTFFFDTGSSLRTPPLTGTASLTANQTFSGANTFSTDVVTPATFALGGVNNTFARFGLAVPLTPDAGSMQTGSTSNSFALFESSDAGFDFANGVCGTTACVDPTLVIHSHNQDATQYNSAAAWGSAGRMIKTLVETTNTSVVQYSIASGAGTGGNVDFTVFCSDGTDQNVLTGVLEFAGVNKAGTETCATPTTAGTALNSASSASTLTCTYAQDTTPTNGCNVQWNCTCSLTQTTLEVYYQVRLAGAGTVTPQ